MGDIPVSMLLAFIDVDDFILNLTGCALGLLLLKAISSIRKVKATKGRT